MESLLDYLLYALFGHNVTNVSSGEGSGYSALTGKTWTFELEGHVYFTLDERDLSVIRSLYESKKEWISDEERARYMRIFDACV